MRFVLPLIIRQRMCMTAAAPNRETLRSSAAAQLQNEAPIALEIPRSRTEPATPSAGPARR